MHPKAKGELTEAIIRAELMKFGHVVLRPEGDNQRYDLVLDTPDGFKRVQCKTGRLKKNGNVFFSVASVRSNTKGAKRRDYHGDIEMFAVYCYENGETYLIPIEDVGVSNCSLRVAPLPKTGSGGKRVLWAKTFRLRAFKDSEFQMPFPTQFARDGVWKVKG